MKTALIVTILTVITAGCATGKTTKDTYDLVDGMTQAEVLQQMGKPDREFTRKAMPVWEYNLKRYNEPGHERYWIGFTADGHVAGMGPAPGEDEARAANAASEANHREGLRRAGQALTDFSKALGPKPTTNCTSRRDVTGAIQTQCQ